MKLGTLRWKGVFFILLLLGESWAFAQTERIQPEDVHYLGAFRLPEGSHGSDWGYSGNAIAYFPDGDPRGPDDGYPGSLFATGNDTQLFVSEISIPAPRISRQKRVEDLNTAQTLQPFTDIFGRVFDYLEQPRVGLCYLPSRSGTGPGKIHFCIGLHLQDTGFEPSHGWFDTDLSKPELKGAWVFDGYSGYVTNDYLCEIPEPWADTHSPGQPLASGRAREGPWSGGGPALFACSPWNDGTPLRKGATLESITPLLLYGKQEPGLPEIISNEDREMPDDSDSDRYRGCAWLTAANRAAVVFVGTKALGESWYGFANGVRWPYDCGQPGQPPCPDVPAWPHDNRGFWATDFQARMIFYDPDDLAAVAKGLKKTWEPKPYAVMDLSPFLFDPDYTEEDLGNYKRDFVGALCFDRERSLLYLMEPVVEEDGRSLVHVFRVQ